MRHRLGYRPDPGRHRPSQRAGNIPADSRAGSDALVAPVSGGLIYYTDWSVGAKTKDLYAGIATKMLLFPVAFFLVARSLCGDLEMVQAATLIAALPTMAAVAMFAQSNRNHGDYA